MLSRAGVVLMSTADVVMVGRYDTLALAELSLGTAVFIPVLVAGIGCLVGVVSVTARGAGAGGVDLPAVALRGLWWATLVGAVAMLPILLGEPALRLIGQEPGARGRRRRGRAHAGGGGAVPARLHRGQLLSRGHGANQARAGGDGVGERRQHRAELAADRRQLGRAGNGRPKAPRSRRRWRAWRCASRSWLWMLRLPEFATHRGRPRRLWGPGGWRAGAEMRRIGLAGGAAYFFETFAFASLAQAAGLIGATALAAYTVLHNIEATVFMIALGLSVATAVRVGQAVGRGEAGEATIIGLAGLTAAMGLIGAIGLVLLAFAPEVAGIYSRDPALLARATPLFAILAVTMVFDAGQVVMGQSTRAMGDGWLTTLAFFVAFWLVMVPVSLALAFLTPLAEAGLFIGTGVGCAVALALLGWRFQRLLRRVA